MPSTKVPKQFARAGGRMMVIEDYLKAGDYMSLSGIIKTVTQYNKEPIPAEDMDKLIAIAKDYMAVKNIVYQRYGGIKSIEKLYPGYDVQNKMNASGVRQRLNMPSVYFNLAVHDATAGIRAEWTRIKKRIQKNIMANEGLNEDDRHYLRFVMKMTPLFSAVLNGYPVNVDASYKQNYQDMISKVNSDKLNRYLCRQVRKQHKLLKSEDVYGFRITKKAYRYADHGIYITGKQKRQRIFVPLTDNNVYTSQLYIRLFPEEGKMEIKAPIERRMAVHGDFTNTIGIALGMDVMLTTDKGRRYGEEYGVMLSDYSDWIRKQNNVHSINPDEGRKKYNRKKSRMLERQHSYINYELNRLIKEEKPEIIYLVKLPKPTRRYVDKAGNSKLSLWQRGYIRERLKQKCEENGIILEDVYGKGIAVECSGCGGIGVRKEGLFVCESCGVNMDEKTNTAKNTKKRGQSAIIKVSGRN